MEDADDDIPGLGVNLQGREKNKRRGKPLIDVNDLGAMQIGLSSPEQIRKWSRGEVKTRNH